MVPAGFQAQRLDEEEGVALGATVQRVDDGVSRRLPGGAEQDGDGRTVEPVELHVAHDGLASQIGQRGREWTIGRDTDVAIGGEHQDRRLEHDVGEHRQHLE